MILSFRRIRKLWNHTNIISHLAVLLLRSLIWYLQIWTFPYQYHLRFSSAPIKVLNLILSNMNFSSLPVQVLERKIYDHFWPLESRFLMRKSENKGPKLGPLREEIHWKENFFFRALPEWGGGGLPMPKCFGPLFRSAFLVNKQSLFLQKCQCIELLTDF